MKKHCIILFDKYYKLISLLKSETKTIKVKVKNIGED
jgi:hypothetical protein